MNANFKELISEELISKIKEFGDLMEEYKKKFEKFQKQIDSFKAAVDKKFKRVDFGEKFYKVICYNGKFIVCVQREVFDNCCNELYDNNNYFLTNERAQEVSDKLNHLMQLERLHDELCPDFIPKWDDELKDRQNNWYIRFCVVTKSFVCKTICTLYSNSEVYFPTEEIAQQACDMLNNELKQTK